MISLLQAELLKLRTTRTFAAIVGTAPALSLLLVGIGASMERHDSDPTRCSPTPPSPTSSCCSARSG